MLACMAHTWQCSVKLRAQISVATLRGDSRLRDVSLDKHYYHFCLIKNRLVWTHFIENSLVWILLPIANYVCYSCLMSIAVRAVIYVVCPLLRVSFDMYLLLPLLRLLLLRHVYHSACICSCPCSASSSSAASIIRHVSYDMIRRMSLSVTSII